MATRLSTGDASEGVGSQDRYVSRLKYDIECKLYFNKQSANRACDYFLLDFHFCPADAHACLPQHHVVASHLKVDSVGSSKKKPQGLHATQHCSAGRAVAAGLAPEPLPPAVPRVPSHTQGLAARGT